MSMPGTAVLGQPNLTVRGAAARSEDGGQQPSNGSSCRRWEGGGGAGDSRGVGGDS